MEKEKLDLGYDIVKEIIDTLENNLHTEYGSVDYKKVHTLSAAYTLLDYFANELAAYPDEEWLAAYPDGETVVEN